MKQTATLVTPSQQRLRRFFGLAVAAMLLSGCGLSRPRARELVRDLHQDKMGDGVVRASVGFVKNGSYEEQGTGGRPSWMGQLEEAGVLANGTPRNYFGSKHFPYSPSEKMKGDLIVNSGRVKVEVCRESVADVVVTGILAEADGKSAVIEYDLHVAARLSEYGEASTGLIPDGRCEPRIERVFRAIASKYDDGWRL